MTIEAIIVSPEMTTLIGAGRLEDVTVPADAAALVFSPGEVGQPASVRIVGDAASAPLNWPDEGASSVTFVVTHEALDRLFGWDAASEDGRRYHLTSTMRIILLAMQNCPLSGGSRVPYLLAKSIELLCEAVQPITEQALVPLAADCALSIADTNRVVAARRLIDEQWAQKLTLDSIARACGLNRAKLTRGFRDLYACSVAEAIAERRLDEARRKLLTTDLPVAVVGYESGYLNNASFARAFGRRYGKAPTDYRACRAAAA